MSMFDLATVLTDVGKVALNGAVTAVSAFVAVKVASKAAAKIEKPSGKNADGDGK